MISIGELIANERIIPVVVGKDADTGDDLVVNVTYRPNALTPAVEQQANDLFAHRLNGCGTAKLLSGLVTAWDIVTPVVGDDDEITEAAIPTTYDGMQLVPIQVLVSILDAITNDVRLSKEDLKNSVGGSRQKAKSARARSFTR